MLEKLRKEAIFDLYKAMDTNRELMKYVLDQAYVIPSVMGPVYNVWHPWLKNYSGEKSLGYWNTFNWSQYIWIDEALKKAMGR